MFFKKYRIYENKLSEHIRDDNPLKQKLVEMETSTDKHPVYSFLSIGLLIYIWLFLIRLIYEKNSYYKLGIVIVFFTTIVAFLTYKKQYLPGDDEKHSKYSFVILIISFLLSFSIPSLNSHTLSLKEMVYEFSFAKVNNASYIALSILAFFNLGIFMSYSSCPYNIYRAFYSVNCTYKKKQSMEAIVKSYRILPFLGIIVLLYLVYMSFIPAEDDFQQKLKKVSMIYYLYFPQVVAVSYSLRRYCKKYFNYTKVSKGKQNENFR